MYKKAFELSYKNKKVEIEIQDFTGTVRNINGTEDLFSLSYISDSKDKGQSILVTEADINFYADDYFNIDELKTVGETDIKVKYYENGALLWSGFVIPDFFSTSVDITPVVSMVATDRIGTLKEISNNAESNIPIQILASCLKQTGQDLPINLIIDNNHFETPIQLERIEDIASYDVIRTFMVLFNCKITLYKNAWWIINKKLLESGFINYKSYNSDGTGGSVTPFAQPILDIDLVDRDGQREIKPTASEISLFLEFGGAKKYPTNWNFNKWSSNKLDNWTSYNGFTQSKNSKVPLRYDSNYSLIYGQDTNINSLLSRNLFFSVQTSYNYINSPHIRSEEVPMQFIKGVSEVTFKIDFSSINDDRFAIYAVLLIKVPNKNPLYHDYVAIGHDGNIVKAGTTNIDLTKVPVMRIQPAFDENQDRLTAIRTTIESKFKISASDDLDLARSTNAKIQIILFGTEYNDGANTSLIDIVLHSANISFNDYEVTGKGLIFKIKQGGEKFSKSRETETILFSDKINQGVNGHFYNYKYDDTSIVDLPSEFALSSVRERADMFSKARDYYSLDGNFIVNPLAKYTCGLKSFVLIGGQNRREDAGIIVEEIVSNALNRTDFIYTYFDDGKDKVKSIGTASGGSSSGGGGGGVSTPQLWKVDEEGNIYTEYNAYSLKNLSAFGFEEEQGGGGGSMDRLDKWVDYDASKSGWVLSAFLGKDLDTRTAKNSNDIGALNQRVETIEGVDSDKNYIHTQGTPSDTWTINHTLNKYPSVTIIDSGGTEIIGDIKYIDTTTVLVTFTSGFSGKAILN